MSEPFVDLPRQFRATAAACPRRPAIRLTDRAVTFEAFDRDSDRIAGWLAGRGLAKGDRVALYALNSDRFALAYMGIVKAGAVVVPVNLMLSPPEAAYVLNDAGVRGLLYDPVVGAAVAAFRPGLKDLACVACLGRADPDSGDAGWDEIMAAGQPAPDVILEPGEDLAAILYTSGTTGYPKGAMLTHRNLAANTWSVKEALQLTPGEDSLLVVLPMFHAFAATAGMLFPLLHGYTFVPQGKFDPGLIARAIVDQGANIFLGVPSMYSVLLRLPEEAGEALKSLKYAISGGAAMPVEVMRRFEARFGVPIYEGDGPTECGPVTSVNPIGGVRKPQTVGLPVPLVEMKICDEQGGRLRRGEIGEICVRGPSVMKGYWGRPDDTAAAFFGEWFRTGDLGTEDEDGYFSIVDRKKDMLIVNGMNVYPRMVEEALYAFEPVREAAVVGEPHDLHGEIPVAYVSLKEGAEAEPADVRAFCRERLGRHEIPRKVYLVEDLPKNAAGKILKRALRKDGERERGIDLG